MPDAAAHDPQPGSGKYRVEAFMEGGAALDFALASAAVSLTGAQRRLLAGRYDHLPPFADAKPSLRALAGAGFELVVLSNGTPGMIAACMASGGLDAWISRQLSVDEVRAYKPSPGSTSTRRSAWAGPPGSCAWCPATLSTLPGLAPPGCGRPG
jgi:FMN phosphatase YigB (HAD superfamily)